MLVLSRNAGERIQISDGQTSILITTVRIGPSTVRIGIDAPRDWNIAREEIANTGPQAGSPIGAAA